MTDYLERRGWWYEKLSKDFILVKQKNHSASKRGYFY
ncbi:hypothetical protein HB665_10790 [Bacillus paranthracis]|uniref:Uncharacterized protein n=1 Tax=Bacillus paranthracis TaxID=2026186 RepID=A0A5M9H3X1_9BACI|nr:hypothetical protein FYW06_03020 [Bacillus paranthracis]KAB7632849.1 hypothetical protein GBN96_25460 [Bacillus sp. B4-WWTP-NA-D-NA-NA]MRA60045.1 hypothetical protein [Bacillus thuringiensis]QPA47133.1 hypothetical protein INQ58_11970 [Bacillus cereus]MBE5112633.1 hypothetical protein [Bacillus paranthracis]